ncbi:hypothetical protein [Gilvimarinus sp. DA14]|uniref:hypothetical protein n=1 Tax=Gilvimarinus sp. DA14 TaxID=2956798 RepID=UPI0020B7CB02|nr:hypothetical protein [Gilvimarinus sp. DA14]UTF61772.1 hypothetical protein NHM04_08275 [Gilvimarinus sp. DA14]
MSAQGRQTLRLSLWFKAMALCTLLSLPCQSLVADSFSDRRALVGIKLFRTLISADLQLAEKQSANGSLSIYFVYATDMELAREHLQQWQKNTAAIQQIETTATVISLQEYYRTQPLPTAVFISQKLNSAELDEFIEYSHNKKIITFSPYAGDVQAGVLAGISVAATIKPLINTATLRTSELSIKDFYLKVAKQL